MEGDRDPPLLSLDELRNFEEELEDLLPLELRDLDLELDLDPEGVLDGDLLFVRLGRLSGGLTVGEEMEGTTAEDGVCGVELLVRLLFMRELGMAAGSRSLGYWLSTG